MLVVKPNPARFSGERVVVVLFEKHPDHPDGEIFIASDDAPTAVAATPAVQAKLRNGEFLLVEEILAPDDTPFDDAPAESAAPSPKLVARKARAKV